MLLSIVVPAFNEERCLGETLASLNRARVFLQSESRIEAELIVVDNDSNDSTAAVARALGARVVKEPRHNIAKVRNTGAKLANGNVLVFVDADTVVPEDLLSRIVEVMSDDNCLGGAIDTDYRPKKAIVRAYLQLWRIIGKLTGMAQGATQFFRREAFNELGGYDESLFMGEDVDLYWRLKKLARRRGGCVTFLRDIQVAPSARRFDQWPIWRTLLWTNPFVILMFRRSKEHWRGWYREAPR